MSPSHRILIADDDSEIRSGAGELLLTMGLEIREAESGERALEVLAAVRDQAPEFVKAVNLGAAIRADLGDHAAARELYDRSLSLDGEQARVLAFLAGLEADAGNAERAEELWAQAAAREWRPHHFSVISVRVALLTGLVM